MPTSHDRSEGRRAILRLWMQDQERGPSWVARHIGYSRGARSQGSNPWQTRVMALSIPLFEQFPLDPISYLRYKTSITLTLWYTSWRRHGTTV